MTVVGELMENDRSGVLVCPRCFCPRFETIPDGVSWIIICTKCRWEGSVAMKSAGAEIKMYDIERWPSGSPSFEGVPPELSNRDEEPASGDNAP